MLRARAKKAIILNDPIYPQDEIEVVEGRTYAIICKSNPTSPIVGKISKIVEEAAERTAFNRSIDAGQTFTLFVDISTTMNSTIVDIKTYNIVSITPVINEQMGKEMAKTICANFDKAEIYRTSDGRIENKITFLGESYGSAPVKICIEVVEIN